MTEIQSIINRMDPEAALAEIGAALKPLLAAHGEEGRSRFIMALIGDSQNDKLSSLVHL
jgi:hypothetical protein